MSTSLYKRSRQAQAFSRRDVARASLALGSIFFLHMTGALSEVYAQTSVPPSNPISLPVVVDQPENTEIPLKAAVDPTSDSELDAGLTELASESALREAQDPRLDIYGFADVSYFQQLSAKDSPWSQYVSPNSHFLVGSLNLYVENNFAEKWRSLAEVRFLYDPAGAAGPVDGTGKQSLISTRQQDPATSGRDLSWGGIEIQRAFIEYQAHPLLTLRVGNFLTPFGIWNVEHSSVGIIGIRQPFVVQLPYFRMSQTGVELLGELPTDVLKFGYHLTLSNGEGPSPHTRDFDDHKAFGGRLWSQYRGPFDAKLGFSFLRGRDTSVSYQYSLKDGLPFRTSMPINAFDEISYAMDFQINFRSWHFQTEWLYSERRYVSGGREVVPGSMGKWFSDYWAAGGYGLVGYRTAFFNLMPYFTTEYFYESELRPLALVAGDTGLPLVTYFGINLRPVPYVAIKLELQRASFIRAQPGSWGKRSITTIQAQIAWSF